MLVSIVMPVYNAEIFLIDSIKSVLEQEYDNLLFCKDCKGDISNDK